MGDENPPRHGEVAARRADGGGHPHAPRFGESPLHQPAAGPPPRAGEELARAARDLKSISATPRLDAELLMAHALGVSREDLLLRHLDATTPLAFTQVLARRLRHEPVAYIIGTRDFWTLTLEVGPGVLIPRPDSETLIEAALAHFAGTPGPRKILDLGTGSGALLLAALAEWPEATGTGVDRSAEALAYARRNADRLGCGDRARIVDGDWSGTGAAVDLVLCNPPYVEAGAALAPEVARFEPAAALFAGDDGLAACRALAPLLPSRLAPGGIACLEVGAGQAAAVRALLEARGLATAERRDLAGIARCVTARRL